VEIAIKQSYQLEAKKKTAKSIKHIYKTYCEVRMEIVATTIKKTMKEEEKLIILALSLPI
jgi:hypothetical protein